MRNLALKELASLDLSPVRKVQIGRELCVPTLLEAGKLELISRTELISLQEGEDLGFEAVYPLLLAREIYDRGLRPTATRAIAREEPQGVIQKVVTEVFIDSLNDKFCGLDKNDVALLMLAREFRIKSWMEAAYMRLVSKGEFLSSKEAERLGIRDVIGVARARESLAKARKGKGCKDRKSTAQVDYKEAMEEAFATLARD